MAVLAVVSGDLWSGGGDPARYPPNATLIGASLRDVRRAASARFAERLDTNAVALYLIGVRVHVDVRPAGMTLIDRRGSAIDTLVRDSHRPRLVRSADRRPAGRGTASTSTVAELRRSLRRVTHRAVTVGRTGGPGG